MKNILTLRKLMFLMFLTIVFCSYSQTNKEKKAKLKTLNAGMYNSSENKEALKYYAQGHEAIKENKYKKAIEFYEKAIAADSNFVEAYDNIGLCYRRMGDLENAIKWYKKSIELYPNGDMAHMNLGVVYGIQKEYDKAIAEYEILQKIDSTNPEGYYGTINMYILKKDYKSAIKNALKTLEIYEATNSPYVADAEYFLGLSYYLDDDKNNARIYLEKAKKHGAKIEDQILKDLKIK